AHRHILLTPVTEQDFLEHLHELDHKINFSLEQSMVDYRSFDDVNALLKKLKIKAVTKIREYLLQKTYALRKPLTNYQIPQNQMLKFRFYNEFLLAHDREIATEIRSEYVNTMSKVYYSYFKAYCSKLTKLQLDNSSEKDVLLGKRLDDQSGTGATNSVMGAMGLSTSSTHTNLTSGSGGLTATGAGSRLGLFGLGDRAVRVLGQSSLESAIILPHVATKAEVKYPIEVLFRSIHFALLDAACREYYFLSDFFLLSAGPGETSTDGGSNQSRAQSGAALHNLFHLVLGRTMSWIQKHTETQLIPSAVHDALGLLICLQLLHAMLRRAKERNVPVLHKFWADSTEALWVRVTDRLDAHIASLQNDFDTTSFVNGVRGLTTGTGVTSGGGSLPARAYALIRPHPIARRYAELGASLHSIGHAFPGTPLFHDSDTPSNKSKVSRFGAFDRTSTDVPRSGSEPDFTISFHGLCSSPRSPSSVSSLTVEPSPALDARILSRLAQLQHQFETVLNRLANSFPRQRLRCVFLINNYDLVISVLSERGAADAPEVVRCRELASQHTATFIDEALAPYFGSLISFVRDVESRHNRSGAPGASSTSGWDSADGRPGSNRTEEARVTRIVKGFNIDWKNSIEKIHGEIMTEFANFTLGTQIFQALLAQLVQHYHRFQQVMGQSPYKNMPVRNQLVNIHHIMNEIKKCKTTF
ncbi:Vacuolar protein sorting-associated protein 52, partial [Fasciolopsis buskii]